MLAIHRRSSITGKPILKHLLRSSLRTFASASTNFVVLGDAKAYDKIESDKAKKHILYFTAAWCPPCRKIGPIYEALSKENTDVLFVKVDIDSVPELAEKNFIRSVPTFIFKQGDKVIEQFAGADETSLIRNMAALKNL
jgi:thiol-disulfide isomerase/thioredoxin